MTDTTTVPTPTAVEDAHNLLRELAETHDWVSVFWDRGWGDSGQPAEVSIIVGGDGQQPKAYITAEVYRELRDRKIIPPNSLKTFKARRLHDFVTPPPPPKPAVDSAAIAETVLRGVLAAMADKPIRVRFYRGLDPNSRTPRILEEIADTRDFRKRAVDGFVLVLPGFADAAISAQGFDFLGPAIIGTAEVVPYPRTAAGAVDTNALAGEEFRAQLVAVIEAKLAIAAEAAGR